jgi:preprotein translocase subunit SecE
MSRALRRQPLIQKPPSKAPSFRPSGPRPQKKQAAAQEAAQRSFLDRFVPGGIKDVISELRKVSWPTREDTVRLTIAVITVSIIIGLLLGGVDLGFNWLVDETLLR